MPAALAQPPPAASELINARTALTDPPANRAVRRLSGLRLSADAWFQRRQNEPRPMIAHEWWRHDRARVAEAAAEGVKYLFAREKGTGKFRHLTKALSKAITSGQNDRYDIIEVWQKFPSTQAFTELM